MTQDVKALEQQVGQLTIQTTRLNATIQAQKQMVIEQLDAMVAIRTNLALFQQANQELAHQLAATKKQVVVLTAENETLKKEIHDKSVDKPSEPDAPQEPKQDAA